MNGKRTGYFLIAILCTLVFKHGAMARQINIDFIQRMTSLVPLYMEGHTGDMAMVRGFIYQSDVFSIDGKTKFGTLDGEVILDAPPFDPLRPTSRATLTGMISFPGIGRFMVNGCSVLLGGLSDGSGGQLLFSWAGEYTDGTDYLAEFYGSGTGSGQVNYLTGQGEIPFQMTLLPLNDLKEKACLDSGGKLSKRMCCKSVGDFPNTCAIGACGCAPADSHEVRVCDCGPGKCFDGGRCAPFDK